MVIRLVNLEPRDSLGRPSVNQSLTPSEVLASGHTLPTESSVRKRFLSLPQCWLARGISF